MPRLIEKPVIVEAAGHPPKTIREYVGRVNTGTESVSIAHMTSPEGWSEPGQQPEFDEYTVVLKGILLVEYVDGVLEIVPGQGVFLKAGEWVRYSTPYAGGAEYIAICLPAFWGEGAHRDPVLEG